MVDAELVEINTPLLLETTGRFSSVEQTLSEEIKKPRRWMLDRGFCFSNDRWKRHAPLLVTNSSCHNPETEHLLVPLKDAVSVDDVITNIFNTRFEIKQTDLIDLNGSMQKYGGIHVRSFDDVVSRISQTVNVEPCVVSTALISTALGLFDCGKIKSIASILGIPYHTKPITVHAIRRRIGKNTNCKSSDIDLSVLSKNLRLRNNRFFFDRGVRRRNDKYYFDFSSNTKMIVGCMEHPNEPYFVEINLLIDSFPDNFKFLSRRVVKKTSLSAALIATFYENPPSFFQLTWTAVFNEVLIYYSDEKTRKRHEFYNQCTALVKTVIRSYYDVWSLPEITADKLDPAFEQLIFRWNHNNDVEEISRDLGIITPSNPEESITCLILNAKLTRSIVQGKPDITTWTPACSRDKTEELILATKDTNLLPLFCRRDRFLSNDRKDILSYIETDLYLERFRLLTTLPSYTSKINNETLMLTSIDDIPLPCITYGTLLEYRVFELEEFKQAWLTHPGRAIDQSRIYSKQERKELYSIFLSLGETSLADKVISCSSENTEIIKKCVEENNRFRERFRSFCWQLFHAGMFLRRWRGHGHSYPLKKSDTLVDVDPEQNGIQALNKCQIQQTELKDMCPEVKDITMEYMGGHSLIHGLPPLLSTTINEILRGDICIRVVSTCLIDTAYYNLERCLKERFPINPKQVSVIT